MPFFFLGGGAKCIMGGVKMVNKLCLEMLYCTCMKSPYRDDKKAKAMATLSVYNIKAKKGDEHRNETVTYIDMTSVLLNSSDFYKADNKNNKTTVTCKDTNIKLSFINQTASIPQYQHNSTLKQTSHINH